jgi:pimeloyl-ACP methyl ester carboxylesterase
MGGEKMKRLSAIVLLALVAGILFSISGVPGFVTAEAATSCDGLAKAIIHAPIGRGFDALLNQAVIQNCGKAMDIGALKILYNTTGGENWLNKAKWLESTDHCSWHGVSCDQVGRVAGLQLANNNLVGAIPAELGLLSSLGNLQLAQNQLSGSIPAQLGNLIGLTYLDMSNNQLSGAIPASLGNLSFLTSLDLSGNQFSGQIPASLGNLSALNSLVLAHNQLSGSMPPELGNLESLEQMELSDNQLSGPIPAELGNIINTLTVLDLANNQLSGQVPTGFGNLTTLTELILSNNPLSGSLPLSLKELENLNTFHFDNTDICEPNNLAFQDWLERIPDIQRTNHFCNIPVIVLPGVMGSELYNFPTDLACLLLQPIGLVWYEEINTPLALLMQTLELKEDKPESQISCNHIFAAQMGDNYGVENTYFNIIESLQDAGYDAKFFPYDWRLSLEYNAEQLNAQIDTWGYAKVDLIGHSMGGLLARTYIENSVYAARVEKVITVAAPYLGAPDMAWVMRTGEIPRPILGLTLGIQPIAAIIRNSPGIMQLLPSDKFFQTYSSYYSYSYFQLFPPATIVTTLNGLSETNDYFKTHPGLYGTQNGRLLDEAAAYHNTYDDFSQINVDYHILSSANLLTRLNIRQNESCILGIGCLETIGRVWGDGTVPLYSAISLGVSSENVHIYPPYNADELTANHADMIKDPDVILDIMAILGGTQVAAAQQAAAKVSGPPQPFIELIVLGSAEMLITDGAGNSSGVDAQGVVVNDIPGATFETTGNQTEVVLPSDRAYTVTFKQVGDIPLQVKVSELTAPSYEGVFTASYQVVFGDIPLSIDGVANMSLDLVAGLENLSLSVVNEGQPEQIVHPSSLMDIK